MTAPDTQKFSSNYQLVAPISGPVLTRADIAGANANGPFAALSADLPIFGQVQQRIPIDAGGGNPQNTVLAVGKVDVALKPGMNFYARYALEHQDLFEGSNFNSPWAGFNTGQKNINNNILASLTNTWSPRFTTQSKIVFNRLDNEQPLGAAPGRRCTCARRRHPSTTSTSRCPGTSRTTQASRSPSAGLRTLSSCTKTPRG
jgi:hypothetical protein